MEIATLLPFPIFTKAGYLLFKNFDYRLYAEWNWRMKNAKRVV